MKDLCELLCVRDGRRERVGFTIEGGEGVVVRAEGIGERSVGLGGDQAGKGEGEESLTLHDDRNVYSMVSLVSTTANLSLANVYSFPLPQHRQPAHIK